MSIKKLLAALGVVTLSLGIAACGDDSGDGGDTAATEEPTDTTGETAGDTSSDTDEPGPAAEPVAQAVEDYEVYVAEQVDEMITLTTTFTDAVRAGDLEAAQAAYAPSRVSWERIEPIAGLIADIDGAVDARVDDFEGVTDPEFTGWHRLEYLLFEEDTTEGAATFADQLDEDLATLADQLADLEIPPVDMVVGGAELIEEVSQGKITGEEDRYSKTDLWDFEANIDGAQKVLELLTPALEEVDPDLLAETQASFDELYATLEPLREGDGWVLFCQADDEYPSDRCPEEPTVSAETIDQLQAQLGTLSENFSQIAGVLGLE